MKKNKKKKGSQPKLFEVKKWIVALRSGEYKKSTGTLQNHTGYCCLGVACDLFIPKDKINYDTNGHIMGGLPSAQYNSPDWLMNIENDFKVDTNSPFYLHSLNDTGMGTFARSKRVNHKPVDISPFTFDEIADVLQMIYVLKVLK